MPSSIISIDTAMEDADYPSGNLTSDFDVTMEEVSEIPTGSIPQHPLLIDSGGDDEYDSEGTLLGDETDERAVPVSRSRLNHREAQSAKVNGCTVKVNESVQEEDGSFERVTSIKIHQGLGHHVVECTRRKITELLAYSYNGRTLRRNKTVEIQDGDFLCIQTVLEDRVTGEIFLNASKFQRTRELNGLLEAKSNEVVKIITPGRSTHIISLATVVRIRELVQTNQMFPSLSFRETEARNASMSKDYINDHGRLVCRVQYVKVRDNEGYLRRLAEDESDEGCAVPEADLRRQFRGRTAKRGACATWSKKERAFELEERKRCRGIDILGFKYLPLDATGNRRHDQRRYTFVDGFCGAGGASRGAHIAGLKVLLGFDQNPDAVATYRQNFPNAKCKTLSAFDFAMSLPEEFRADVLHLSPPCQPFSPAHTRPGQDDERNEATFLATEVLIKKIKPRVVTLEETFGLTRTVANLTWFRAMIQMLTKLGFSVRWKVFNFLDFGLPQPRKRLIVFASCPGERLPDFPEPTHCKPEDLHRFPPGSRTAHTTIDDAISLIPPHFPNHDIVPFPPSNHNNNRKTNPYPSNRHLTNTITCAGNILHPSGTRYVTLREVACLQGFPLEHRFFVPQGRGGGARRQIGNAWPPVVSWRFFERIVEALRGADECIGCDS